MECDSVYVTLAIYLTRTDQVSPVSLTVHCRYQPGTTRAGIYKTFSSFCSHQMKCKTLCALRVG